MVEDTPTSSNGTTDGIPHKMNIMLLTNCWNDKNERIIISVGENAASYKWMHERSASYYGKLNKICSLALLLLSTGLSAETTIGITSENTILNTITNIVTYLVTVLSVLINFFKFEKTREQHLSSAIEFSKLYHDIQQQMCMYRRFRKNAITYVSDTLKLYDTLVLNGPNVTQRIVSNFKKTFKTSDIAIPDIADRIEKIELATETQGDMLDNNNNVNNTNQNLINNNLNTIHNVFQISGDITDKDIEQASPTTMKYFKERYLAGKSDFEMQRFLKHSDYD